MERTKVLQRLHLLKKHPELYRDLSNQELAELVLVVLSQVDVIDKAIKDGRLDGYTPQPGKDYLSKKECERLMESAVKDAVHALTTEQRAALTSLMDKVATRLDQIRDGNDGEDALITPELVQAIAVQAAEHVELPDFTVLITQEAAAVRDALLLLSGEDRLPMEAIHGLLEAFDTFASELRNSNQVAQSRIGATVARKLGQIRDVDLPTTPTNGQVLTYHAATGKWRASTPSGGGGGGVSVETPTGSVDGSNTEFTVTAEPQWVVADGTVYFDGAGYTYTPLTITMEVAPSASIRAII